MRGKKWKKLLTWLLCICMLMGLLPTSAFAADIKQQSQSTEISQEAKTNTSTSKATTETKEKTTEMSTEQKKTEEKTTTQAEATTEKKTETTKVATQSQTTEENDKKENASKKIATQSQIIPGQEAKVSVIKLLDKKNGTVWGDGIITGSADLDEGKCWDGKTDKNRGYDDSSSNNIIRSFDSINYNVSTTIVMDGNSHKLNYEVTLPDDEELTLDQSAMKADKISGPIKKNGKKTYTCEYSLESNYAGGEKEINIIVKVGNKHQGYEIKPEFKAYLDNDTADLKTVENMKPVIVTTAPMYNIVLKQKAEDNPSRNIYNFDQENTNGKTFYKENAKDYKDYKVNGYERTYGFALEMKKDTKGGIKGVEFPDPKAGFTFDVDISDATLVKNSEETGTSMVTAGFTPLLYYTDKNRAGGGAVWNIPYTDPSDDQKGCYNSGKLTMTQDGTILHVTVKDFAIDRTKFPKSNLAKESYWQDINKILEGNFSAYQFHVVYPYINEKDENLLTKIGDGTINVKAVAKNMKAVSEVGTSTDKETTDEDNSTSSSWAINSGGKRDQQIYYSKRNLWTDEYTDGRKWNDGDIAAAGTKDLGFTVAYDEADVGEAYDIENVPVAIDQMVLFDRNALDNVTFNRATTDTGYSCNVLYAVYEGGRLDNESMKTADLSKFKFYKEKPEDGCDGVLLQYRGANTGKANLGLLAQCFADVKANVTVDKVYMITAITNSWTAKDLENKILAGTGKKSLSELSHKELSDWVKKQDPTEFVKGQDHTPGTLDPRSVYTFPTYVNGVYDANDKHKTNVAWADGLYIVPYTTTVTKTVAQLDEKGNPRDRYNVSKGQRFADYKISSAIRYGDNVTPPDDATTTVYLEDTLPKGLTYMKGSAHWGGEYTSKFPQAGVVAGGDQIEPEVTSGKNGTTILKWEIKKVKLQNGELPTLYYSCQIGDELHPEQDIEDNENLKNTVTIQTDEDKRPINEKVNNIDTTAISVAREKEFYIVKRGGDSLELQDASSYELIAANTSSDAKEDLWMFDTLPYKNDGKSKQMDGAYKIKSLTMDQEAIKNANDIEVWYTNEAKYNGKTAKNFDFSSLETTITAENGWKKASESRDGKTITFKGEGLVDGWPTAIVYKDKSLESNSVAALKLTYEAVAGAENDEFTNTWSTMSNGTELPSSVDTDVYKRTLEGTVWFDKNQDGKIDEKESKLKDVKVTLLKDDGNGNYKEYTAYDETVGGKTYKCPSTLYTDDNGHYKFTGLPSGNYRVKFESSDGTDLGFYDVTKADADEDITKTSKVKETGVEKDTTDGTLKSGTIEDIKMPTLDEMVAKNQKVYNLPDQNLGLVIPTINIPVTKTWDDSNNRDGKRPSKIEVELYADGTKIKTLTLDVDHNWEGAFTDLPKYSEKNLQQLKAIKYEVKETSVTDYETKVTGNASDGFTVTNKHMIEKINIPVEKTWNDNDNQDGKRPTKITVYLQKDGKDTTNKIELTAENGWKGEFKDLDKYEEGKTGEEIKYSVREEAVTDYTAEPATGSVKDGFKLTNTHTPEKINVSGTKTWNDQGDQDGKRPDKITIRLFANGKEVDHKDVTEDANGKWNWNFENLDKYQNGQEITYTVTEDAVANYTSEVKDYDVTNSYTPGKVNISVTKAWVDGNNQDGKRAKEVTVRLYADGKETDQTLKLSDANNWTASFDNLDEYRAKQKIEYTVKEEGATSGYTSKVTGDATKGYTITNTHKPETVNISGSKTWNDANNQDGKRPDKITIRLLADNVEVATKNVTANDNWKWEFKDQPKYSAGKEINYTIKEDAVENYKTTIKGFDVTNSYTPGKVNIPVKKTWEDAGNQDGVRPEKITVQLLADGADTGKTLDLTKDNNWSDTFKGLDEYKAGKKITYTIKEVSVKGYESAITGTAKEGYTITNKHTPETVSVSGSKTWKDNDDQDGVRPDTITIRLHADGKEVDSKTATADDGWAWNFTNLAKYKAGKEIVYTVTEDVVPNYTSEVKGTNVINTHNPGKTSIAVTKAWVDGNDQDGIRPDSITVHLYADGVDTGKTITVKKSDNWAGSFINLDEKANGQKIKYTIKEDETKGYTSTISGDATKGYIVTNKHTPEVTEVSGIKTWNDNDNQDGIRPDKITIHLFANGTEVSSKEVTEDNNWSYNFTNLPKNADGKAIVYTVTEDAVKDYTTEVNGYNVTNTHNPEKTSVTVNKEWVDGNNQDGIRPDSITVHLYADGVDTGKTITLKKSDNWVGSFTDLDAKSKGQTIKYTVKEDKVEGYETEITGDATTGYVVTNKHTPEVTEVSGSKKWDDKDNQDGKRPDKITIRLLANGIEVANKEVTEKDNWSYNFTNLPKNEDGKVIVYTITEDAVTDYTTTINGYDVTNSYTPGKISVTVTKSWSDKNNKYKKRPSKVTVHLYADGVDTGKKLTLTKATNWSGSFTDLDQYKAGKVINYTIKEDKVTNYTDKITGDTSTGYVVTNTYKPNKPGIPDDEGLQDKDRNNSSSDSDSSSSSESSSDSRNGKDSGTYKSAKTGDTNAMVPCMIACIASFGVAITLILRRRKLNK